MWLSHHSCSLRSAVCNRIRPGVWVHLISLTVKGEMWPNVYQCNIYKCTESPEPHRMMSDYLPKQKAEITGMTPLLKTTRDEFTAPNFSCMRFRNLPTISLDLWSAWGGDKRDAWCVVVLREQARIRRVSQSQCGWGRWKHSSAASFKHQALLHTKLVTQL